MPPRNINIDQLLAVRSSRWVADLDEFEAIGITLEEVTFHKENDAQLRAWKEADALEEQKEQSDDK
jgi:hypothetical protein